MMSASSLPQPIQPNINRRDDSATGMTTSKTETGLGIMDASISTAVAPGNLGSQPVVQSRHEPTAASASVQSSPSLSFNAFASTQVVPQTAMNPSPAPNAFAQSTSSSALTGVNPLTHPPSPSFHTPFTAIPPKEDPFGDIAAFGSATKPIAPPPNIDHWSDFQ
jgi:hypothetical protein